MCIICQNLEEKRGKCFLGEVHSSNEDVNECLGIVLLERTLLSSMTALNFVVLVIVTINVQRCHMKRSYYSKG